MGIHKGHRVTITLDQDLTAALRRIQRRMGIRSLSCLIVSSVRIVSDFVSETRDLTRPMPIDIGEEIEEEFRHYADWEPQPQGEAPKRTRTARTDGGGTSDKKG